MTKSQVLLPVLGFVTKWSQLILLWPVLVAQSYLTLCDPMDCNPQGFSVLGILQAKILEWVAISFSRAIIFLSAAVKI